MVVMCGGGGVAFYCQLFSVFKRLEMPYLLFCVVTLIRP